MIPNKKTVLLCAALTIASVVAYLGLFRADFVENEYIKSRVRLSAAVVGAYRQMVKEGYDHARDEQRVAAFLKKVNLRYPGIAMIIVALEDNTIQIGSKNDRLISSQRLYDLIVGDFKKGAYRVTLGGRYITKTYTAALAQTAADVKFHLFCRPAGKEQILFVFPDRPVIGAYVQLALEGVLVGILCILLISFVFKYREGKNVWTAGARQVDLQGKTRSIEAEVLSKEGNAGSIASETLKSAVYQTFKKIYDEYLPSRISLYIARTPGTLTKSFELKGRSFIKIDSQHFDSIDCDNELGRELRNATLIVTDQGTRIIIPLTSEGNLVGAIHVLREEAFDGNTIQKMRSEAAGLVRHIGDYLVVHSVILDRDTELYSKTYFKIKYGEELKLARSHGRRFSLIMIALSRDFAPLAAAQKSDIIKIVVPTLDGLIEGERSICSYDDFLGIILPGLDKNGAVILADRIEKALWRFTIKVSGDTNLQLTPAIGIASSDTIGMQDDMLATALQNLDNQLSRVLDRVKVSVS